jgi:hypothetical protein
MFACLCAAILAARRSGHPEARLEVMVKLMAFEKLGGRPRVYAAMLRRMRRDLKDATPAYEARVLKGMNEAMIAMGEWDAAVSCLRRASAQLAALGYRYEVLECTGRVNSVLQHTGDFRQLLDNVWEDERVARRLEQSTILRWTLLFKMQAWLRTGSGTLDAAEHCLRAIHAIPTHRTQLEEIRLWANEALVLAVRGDVDGVIQAGAGHPGPVAQHEQRQVLPDGPHGRHRRCHAVPGVWSTCGFIRAQAGRQRGAAV